jgi:monoamine oxidase
MSTWETEPFARGLRHAYRPGDVTRFAPILARTHGPDGRFHLAGEHTRREEFGMEAALESADRVVSEILSG